MRSCCCCYWSCCRRHRRSCSRWCRRRYYVSPVSAPLICSLFCSVITAIFFLVRLFVCFFVVIAAVVVGPVAWTLFNVDAITTTVAAAAAFYNRFAIIFLPSQAIFDVCSSRILCKLLFFVRIFRFLGGCVWVSLSAAFPFTSSSSSYAFFHLNSIVWTLPQEYRKWKANTHTW